MGISHRTWRREMDVSEKVECGQPADHPAAIAHLRNKVTNRALVSTQDLARLPRLIAQLAVRSHRPERHRLVPRSPIPHAAPAGQLLEMSHAGQIVQRLTRNRERQVQPRHENDEPTLLGASKGPPNETDSQLARIWSKRLNKVKPS